MKYDCSIPFVKYQQECESLLKEFAKNYKHTSPAHQHSDSRARETSQRISSYVFDNWREEFRDLNYPTFKRQNFKPYVQGDN